MMSLRGPDCRFILAFFVLVLSASTATTADETAPPDFGQEGLSFWTVQTIAGAVPETPTMLRAHGDSLGLYTQCGGVSVPYKYGVALKPRVVPIMTGFRLGCGSNTPSPMLEAYKTALRSILRLRVVEDQLTMFDGDSVEVLTAQRIVSTGIENRKWRIDRFRSGDSLVSVAEGPSSPRGAWIILMNDDLEGEVGCGILSGGYSVADKRVDLKTSWFSILGGSCDRTIAEPIAHALTGDLTMEWDGDDLILRDQQGETRAVLAPWTGGALP